MLSLRVLRNTVRGTIRAHPPCNLHACARALAGFQSSAVSAAKEDSSKPKVTHGHDPSFIREMKQYKSKVSDLRKVFAEEVAARNRDVERKIKEKRERQMVHREEVLRAKSERSVQRAAQIVEEVKLAKTRGEDERKARYARLVRSEQNLSKKKARTTALLRQESVTWIEPDQLQSRIFQALADPHAL
ncbi:hypothetical protein CBR_g38736 [Chara braunii]|uniref:Uncharacterized protein n=1 Tax=Chara braunii TaxID=69332 RepID=A0A388LQH9_CHABU|nr:hypothetical protein CBR_g38736 [Chara braunii]|eukprot:GBG84452.1 hypothetical protein CBR_g38736 [Chara braunii]